MRNRLWIIVSMFIFGAIMLLVGFLFRRADLAQDDQWASVLSFFVGALSLLLGVVQMIRQGSAGDREHQGFDENKQRSIEQVNYWPETALQGDNIRFTSKKKIVHHHRSGN